MNWISFRCPLGAQPELCDFWNFPDGQMALLFTKTKTVRGFDQP